MDEMSHKDLTEEEIEVIEKIFEVIHELNLHVAIKDKPSDSLADMLATKKITHLRDWGRLYHIRGFSKMDKQAIIPALMKHITDKDALVTTLLMLEKHEWDLLKQAVRVKHVTGDELFIGDYRFLFGLGILWIYYHDGHFYYVIPAEIKEIYEELEKDGFPAEKERSDLLNDYAIAAANLYGVISIEDFVALFNSQNKHITNIDEVFSILTKFAMLEYGYYFWEDYLVNDDLGFDDHWDSDDEEIEYYIRSAASKPRYIPSKEEFLRYADWDYIEETPYLSKLRAYINENLFDDPEQTDDYIDSIHYLSQMEVRPQAYIDLFEDDGILLEFEQIEALMMLIMDVNNNTRMWRNNGRTPNEVFGKEGARVIPLKAPLRIVKTGRNEPCPCGSGKKYKQCCGKEDLLN